MIDVLKATLEVLESKAVVYSQFYGADSDEVRQLDKEIYALNMRILDAMVDEVC
jgi:hypothetical protein